MENGISELRRRANSRWDIEGQTDLTTNFHGHLPWTHNSDFSPIYSFICPVAQICRLIDTYKRRVFGLLFLVLETGSAVLDGIGKGKSDLLLAAFVLSTIGFLITFCACVKRRARSTSTIEVPAVRQLRVVEFVFSSIQLIASLLQFILAHLKDKKILDVKNNIDASVFPVAFAMVAVVFIFKNDEAITNSSQEGFQQPVKLDVIGTLARNEDSPSILDIKPESSSDTVLPANNVPQEGFQQPVKVDVIGTLARNEDSPSILDILPASSSDTLLPANNVPQAVFQMPQSSSATRLRAPFFNNVPPPPGQIRHNIFVPPLRSATTSTSNPPPAHKSD